MVLNKLKAYGELVMFSHTLFSLPFAMISMIWAAEGLPGMKLFILILVALISGRTGANALNRWVDKDIDKKNPRTSDRQLPQGRMKGKEVLGLTAICFIIFEIAAFLINPLCFYLSPLALFLFCIYSYTKRFTWASHIVLGIAIAGAPVGAWLAVRGEFDFIPIILGAIVALWVAGFDMLYATQDIEFDRSNKLYSIPAYFGLKNGLLIAKCFHVMMIILLYGLAIFRTLGIAYFIGITIAAGLLIMEHFIVKPENRGTMKIASYGLNQVLSVVVFTFTIVDFLIVG